MAAVCLLDTRIGPPALAWPATCERGPRTVAAPGLAARPRPLSDTVGHAGRPPRLPTALDHIRPRPTTTTATGHVPAPRTPALPARLPEPALPVRVGPAAVRPRRAALGALVLHHRRDPAHRAASPRLYAPRPPAAAATADCSGVRARASASTRST